MINQDDAVRRSWEEVSSEWEPDEAQVLLSLITELWNTVRGLGMQASGLNSTKSLVQGTKERSH